MAIISTPAQLDAAVQARIQKFINRGLIYDGIEPNFEDSTVDDGTYLIKAHKTIGKRVCVQIRLPYDTAGLSALIDQVMPQLEANA